MVEIGALFWSPLYIVMRCLHNKVALLKPCFVSRSLGVRSVCSLYCRCHKSDKPAQPTAGNRFSCVCRVYTAANFSPTGKEHRNSLSEFPSLGVVPAWRSAVGARKARRSCGCRFKNQSRHGNLKMGACTNSIHKTLSNGQSR